MTSSGTLKAAVLACTTVALAARGTWFNLVGYSPAFVAAGDQALASSGRFGFMATSALFVIVFALLGSKAIGLRTPIFPLVPVLMLMGTGMFGLASNQSIIDPGSMFLVGGALLGIGNAWGTLCAYSILGRTGSLWHVVVCCSISSSLSAIASAFVQDLGGSGDQVTAALVLVIIVFIALFAAFKLLERFDIAAASPTRDDKPRTLGMGEQLRAVARSFSVNRGQVLQLAMITLAMIALRGSSNGGVWGDQRVNGSMFAGSLALMIALFLAVALVSFWVFFKNPSKTRYHIPLLVLIGCFLILAVAGDSLDATTRITLNSAIELFCQLIFTFAVVDSMRKMPSAGIAVAGLAAGFSWVLALCWMFFFESIGSIANIAIVVVAYLLVVLVASPNVASADKKAAAGFDSENDAFAENVNPFDGVIQRSKALSERYRLTKREGEILELLAQGRSVPYICNELVLAEGTVRTHMTRIYKKLDIHSKQELFDLLTER